jgi:hypothetical protein
MDQAWGTIIAGLLGFVGTGGTAVLGIYCRRLEARLRQEVDLKVKAYEADLKQHVDVQVQKARGEVEQQLKTHEVRLRIAAEYRLKMLDRMLSDVAAFRAQVNNAVGAIYLLAQEAEIHGLTDGGHDLLRDAKQSFAAVPSAGPFMPPALGDDAMDIVNGFHDCLRDVAEWANLPMREDREQRCRGTLKQMETLADRSRELFGTWMSAQFTAFEELLDRVGEGHGSLPIRDGMHLSRRNSP